MRNPKLNATRGRITRCALLLSVAALCGCDRGGAAAGRGAERPNILWIVMDTTRADHLSVYGYGRPTTPNLERWARDARVFEDVIAPGVTTQPTHASMFTGLLPSQHGTNYGHRYLDEHHHTVAELLRDAGYDTYLWSANPHISAVENFSQGFDAQEHPWDPKYSSDAIRIVRSKIPPHDRASELPQLLRDMPNAPWTIKACGELTQRGVMNWLTQRPAGRPYLIFLNYMEPHRVLIPPLKYRERFLTPEQVKRSYEIDFSRTAIYAYCFGQITYSAEDLAVLRGMYDAAVNELDELLGVLLDGLAAGGYLQNTVIVVTADHGELLGEHHMVDHQYAVYEPLLRVPLILHYPARVAAGRERRPVMTMDLFPTLLELAGVPAPAGLPTRAVSLLAPLQRRPRLAEYPVPIDGPFKLVQDRYPTFDATPWNRDLRAFIDGPLKLICSRDEPLHLYDLSKDPDELHDLLAVDPAAAAAMRTAFAEYVRDLRLVGEGDVVPQAPDDHRRRLEGLGYVGSAEDAGAAPATAPRPAAGGPPPGDVP